MTKVDGWEVNMVKVSLTVTEELDNEESSKSLTLKFDQEYVDRESLQKLFDYFLHEYSIDN